MAVNELSSVDHLRHEDREALCQSLDVLDDWESLAAAFDMAFETIQLLKRNYQSPSRELLNILGERSTKVVTLYYALGSIQQFRAMSCLENYVPEAMRLKSCKDTAVTACLCDEKAAATSNVPGPASKDRSRRGGVERRKRETSQSRRSKVPKGFLTLKLCFG